MVFFGTASIYVCMCWFGSCCDYHFFCSFGETLKWSSRFLAIIRFMVQTVFNKINWIRMIARSKWFIHKRRRCAMQPQNRDWYANTYFFVLKRFPHANKKCFIRLTSFKMCWYHFKWTSTFGTTAASCKKETQNTNINKMKMKVSAQKCFDGSFFLSFWCYCYGKNKIERVEKVVFKMTFDVIIAGKLNVMATGEKWQNAKRSDNKPDH